MAFEKHAAQEEPVSAGAWEKKQKRRTDMDKADSVKRTSTYAVTDDAEKSKPAGGTRAGSGLPIFLLCILMIASGMGLMYKDISRTFRHGIYRCEYGGMLEEPRKPDDEKITMAAGSMEALSQTYPNLQQYVMLVPTAACILPDYLPESAEIRDQKADLANIQSRLPGSVQWIDLVQLFSDHSGEKLYYASDRYLTGWGSRYAARAAIEAMGEEIPEGKDQCYLLSNSFSGRFAMDRIPSLHYFESSGERLEIYVPENEACYYRVDGRSKKWSGSLYDADAAQSTAAYNVFFGGEKALTEIHTTRINAETLLVIGDRTADSIVPLFVSSFENIVFVHPSKTPATVEKLVKKYNVTKVLYLYGANEYMTDRTLLRTLQQ